VTPAGAVLDTNGIAISTAAYNQRNPAVAFDGTNHLVVWEDGRHSTPTENYDIYGGRLTTAGVVLDTNGVHISTLVNDQMSSRASFDGSNYLVVWEDRHNGTGLDIAGVRVSSDSIILDAVALVISMANDNQWSPAIAFDGTNYLVTWADGRSDSSDIYGARVTPAGAVLDTNGIAIATAGYHQAHPAVTFDGTNYLVVWKDHRNGSYSDVYGARVTPAGTVLDPGGIAISTAAFDQRCPEISFDGTNYLVVWEDVRSISTSDIYGARVTQAGTVLDPGGIAISIASNNQWSPGIAFDGTNYLTVWKDWRNNVFDVYCARVTPEGVVLDPNGIYIFSAASNRFSPAVVFDGIYYVITWEDSCNGSFFDILGARVTPDGVVIGPMVVSSQPGDQISPSMAAGSGGQVLITYSGFVAFINGHPANTMRIWGKFYPFTGITEDIESRTQNTGYCLEICPNPFMNGTCIKFHIPSRRNATQISGWWVESRISLEIYDAIGRLVKQFDSLNIQSFNQVVWSGDDDSGRLLPAGIYFCRLLIDGVTITEKAVKIQ
jgi:hypothetical protein